jgi:hypothetical protein
MALWIKISDRWRWDVSAVRYSMKPQGIVVGNLGRVFNISCHMYISRKSRIADPYHRTLVLTGITDLWQSSLIQRHNTEKKNTIYG